MEFFVLFLLRGIVPFVLALVSLPVVGAFGIAASAGVYFTLVIIWLVIINGGFLFLDGDLNLFD